MLFGGHDGVSYRNDTWFWDGAAWTEVLPHDPTADDRPSPRAHHAMAYDKLRNRLVLFGGSAPGSFGDTWEWTCQGWNPRCTPANPCDPSPSAREAHSMATDPNVGVVLYGGGGSDETWGWNGERWTQHEGAGPHQEHPRYWNTMAYNANEDKVVLFGGGDTSDPLDDTWKWDGSTWSQSCPHGADQSPFPRFQHAMAYDWDRRRLVLFGGSAGSSGKLNDTWESQVVEEECCLADLNCDGLVDAADLAELLGSWGPCCGDGICLEDESCDLPDECEADCGQCR